MAMSDYQTKMLELEERKAAALEHIGSRVFEFLNQHEEHHEAMTILADTTNETLVEINNHLAIVAMSGTEE